MKKKLAIIGTLDTKEAETSYVADLLARAGQSPIIIDVGPLTQAGAKADYGNREIARRAGWDIEELVKTRKRDEIMSAMAKGASSVLLDLFSRDELGGVLGLGGNQGSAISSLAMRGLPIGLPKVLVSTVASGNIRPYIGCSDIAVMFSVADLVGGPNPVSRAVLGNAAFALVGMAERSEGLKVTDAKKTLALTALGNTEPSAQRILTDLKKRGFEVVAFHASGAGGSAMESLIERGIFGGVIDLTTHELAEEVAGVGSYVPVRPGRLTAAGRMGLPQIVSLGGLEYFCGGPRTSIPPSHRRRKIYMHNPFNANVKLTATEMAKTGMLLAQRLSEARGPVEVLVPLKGWSVYGSKGGPFYDPRGNAVLLSALTNNLRKGLEVREIDAHINDEAFSEACTSAILKYLKP